MSRVVLFLLSFAILFQSVQRTWIVAAWKANQSYIASELCEKRFEVNSCCAGSCYLDKQLEKNKAQEQSLPSSDKKQQQEYVCEPFSFSVEQRAVFFTSYFLPVLWSSGKPQGYNGGIFHPPAFLG